MLNLAILNILILKIELLMFYIRKAIKGKFPAGNFSVFIYLSSGDVPQKTSLFKLHVCFFSLLLIEPRAYLVPENVKHELFNFLL